MSATAQPLFGVEAHAPDDVMDLHTDDDFALGDGDIDLDIGSAVDANNPEDDVLSLQDAGTDGGVDLPAPSGSHDDFMVDEEDVIEEDDIDYGDIEIEIGDADQPSFDNIANAQDTIVDHVDLPGSANLETTTYYEETVDEELIDYSDDEAEQTSKAPPTEQQEQPLEEIVEEDKAQDPVEHQDDAGHVGEVEENAANLYNEAESQTQNETVQATWHEDAGSQYSTALDSNTERQPNTAHSNDEGPDTTKTDEHSADVVNETPKEVGEHNYQEEDKDEPHHAEYAHPITINYDGSEFWLFKPENNEDGDWLLTDYSLAAKPIYDLFNACRAQLADDVNSDTELGFRFDHFHALTVYEDSTACAVTSLQDLLELYLELQGQDGNSDPESFFITLQFRPRVVSLIGELKKAAQDQIGFSGWKNRIATGQTIFTSSYSHEQAEDYQEQWEGDRLNNEDEDHAEVAKEEYDHSEEDGDDGDDDGDKPVNKDDQYDDTGSNESPANDNASSKATPRIQDETSHRSNSEGASDEGSHEGEVAEEAEDVEEAEEAEEGIVDYSDDEGQSETAPGEEPSGNDGSSNSSTVEGDDASYAALEAEDSTNHADSYENTRESENDEDGAESTHDEDTAEAGNADSYEQHDQGANPNDDDEYPYDDLDRGYEQGYPLDNAAQAFGGNDYATEGVNQGREDYYYEDGNTAFYEQDEFALVTHAHDAAANDPVELDGQEAPAEDDLNGVDNFLDLIGDAEDNGGEDTFASFANDEAREDGQLDVGGAPSHAPVAESPAAPAAVASPNVVEDQGSPQGLKRPIDQVDMSRIDAGDPADSKRQKL